MDIEDLKTELLQVKVDIDLHATTMAKAMQSVQQAIQNDAAIVHLDDLRKALQSFTAARKSVERAKSAIKARINERIKG